MVDGPPATLAELAAVEEDLTAGAMQADVVATNQRPLDLQLLQASKPASTPARYVLAPFMSCCAYVWHLDGPAILILLLPTTAD